MKKSELLEMPLSELRTIAKNEGIKAERTWKKDDFVKMILQTEKATHKKKTKKTTQKTTSAKEEKPQKSAQKIAAKKPAKKSKTRKPVIATISRKKPVKPAPKKEAAVSKSFTDIGSLTVAELKLIAKECGIKILKDFRKADILKAITKAKSPTHTEPEQKKTSYIKCSEISKPESAIDIDDYRPALYKKLSALENIKAALSEPVSTKNRLTSMIVSQDQMLVFWQIIEKTFGSLNLKFTDSATGAFFYIPVADSAAERVVCVKPGCIYDVEIGTIAGSGRFSTIARSKAAKTPSENVRIEALNEGAKLPPKFFRTPLPKGSY
ncbi:MAG: Rho termination factor N-terminal domain-containing protein [Nitrospirae bacterium]|nr:Rho termination factor N-terminal domain-containing protein [Nitrospirota bacterium]